MEQHLIIKTKELTKNFGKFCAVDHISLNIGQGEIYALIGPNGAGKTTLIKLLVGLLSPTSGGASIAGFDIATHPIEAKRQFGYISDDPNVYDFLSGREFLSLTGNLRGVDQAELRKRVTEMAKIFPFDQLLTDPISSYSRGNKQKLAFLTALLANPKVLIIDEPVVGLDPKSVEIFGAKLREFAKNGGCVFLATHTLLFAQKFAHVVGFMQKGKILEETKVNASTKIENLYQKLFQ